MGRRHLEYFRDLAETAEPHFVDADQTAGRHIEAIRLIGAADALREATGASAPIVLMRMGAVEAEAREAIGEEAFDNALSEGRRMSLDEAVEYAVSLGS